MTRRQVYFYVPDSNTYYITEEINGDQAELEAIDSRDYCDKTWDDIVEELSHVQTLPEFMDVSANITHYYHSCISSPLTATRLIVKHSCEELETKDETWGIIAGCPRIFKDNRFSICGGEKMFYNGRPLYGESDFSYSSVKVGDYVTQDVVNDAVDCRSAVYMVDRCSQSSEPYSVKYDERSGKARETYVTFRKVGGEWPNGIWEYCGHCFRGENKER